VSTPDADDAGPNAATPGNGDFRILIASVRPSVAAFFAALGNRSSKSVSTTRVELNPTAVARASRAVASASVAIVDASIDPGEAVAVCRQLRTPRADLPIGILFCCPHSATTETLRPFLDLGIGSFLDLQLSAAQTLAALRGIARGEGVVRLQLSRETSAALFNGHDEGERLSDDELVLLRLVATGMTDLEIAREMFLSHHTVKHRIERLRHRAHARNRVQLAAWAGRLEPFHVPSPPVP
jgi:two-component system response regulator DevR